MLNYFMQLKSKPRHFWLCLSTFLFISTSVYLVARPSKYEQEAKLSTTLVSSMHYNNKSAPKLTNADFIHNLGLQFDSQHSFLSEEDLVKLDRDFPDAVTDIRQGRLDLLTPLLSLMKERKTLAYEEMAKYLNSLTAIPNKPGVLIPEERAKTINELKSLWPLKVDALILNDVTGKDKLTFAAAKAKLTERFSIDAKRLESLTYDQAFTLYLNAWCQLLDPHSNYFSKEQMEDLNIMFSGSLVGVGLKIESEGTHAIIRETIPGGPAAEEPRILPGTKILAVNNDSSLYKTSNELVQQIRGPINTNVTLELSNVANGTFTVTLKRTTINIAESLVSGKLLDNKVLYIRVPSFYQSKTNSTSRDVEALLKQHHDAAGVLLDLRGNGGGQLTEATRLVSLFTSSKYSVQVEDSNGKVQAIGPYTKLDSDTDRYTGPVVVVINAFSASASEIVAGALQDYKRAVIVGDTHSYGKGSVQNLSPFTQSLLPMKGNVKVTIQRYYLPSGRSIQTNGIKSDFVLSSPAELILETHPKVKSILDTAKTVPPAPMFFAENNIGASEFQFTGNALSATMTYWKAISNKHPKEMETIIEEFDRAKQIKTFKPSLTEQDFTKLYKLWEPLQAAKNEYSVTDPVITITQDIFLALNNINTKI